MPFTLSPGRLAVSMLCGALATGIFHMTQHGRTASAASAAVMGVFDPRPNGMPASVSPGAEPARLAPLGTTSAAKAPGQPQADRAPAITSTRPPASAQVARAPGARQPQAKRAPDAVPAGAAAAGVRLAAGHPPAHVARRDDPALLAVARSPRRIVFRHGSPGIVVLTLEGDRLDVEFKEGR